MIQQLFKGIKISQSQQSEYDNDDFRSQKTTKYQNAQLDNFPSIQVHTVGAIRSEQQQDHQQHIDEIVLQDIKAIMNTAIFKSRKTYSKQYIPLGSIVDNAYLKQHEIKNLHFQHISLNSVNQSSLHKVVFKHNEQDKEIRFYIPTFLRFSLIKLHSEDLKNITHIQNKNNLIIYINVYTKGLPKMLIDKLTRKTKNKDGEEQPKLLFRANRHLFEAKYYTSYNDYMIFMFNAFSQNMVEFEIMKNVMFAPFEQAQLILHIRINKKIFKLERSKTLKIARSSKNTPFEPQSPIRKRGQKLDASIEIQNQILEEQYENEQEEAYFQDQFDILNFNKIIMQFKLQKPKNVSDSFRFHKSIQFGNYGIMTNQINIHIGTYESPEKKKQLEEEKASLNFDQEDLHQAQLQDISSLRLSIGLYKHPVTDVCTFFLPLTLAGGLTLLLFHMCDHSLSNQLEVLSIILVAYGAFIPQFRDRISMSRTVILVDFYIVYNMIPAVLCALQSITESRHKKTYNSYEIISTIMYYVSILFLIEIYALYLFIDGYYFRTHTKEMVHNFDTDIFETQDFMEEQERYLSWYVLKNQKERAFFCERQQATQKSIKRPKFTRKQTRYSARPLDDLRQSHRRDNQSQLAQSLALQIRMSSTTNKSLHEVKQSQQEQQNRKHEQHQYLYKTKVIQNQRHIHSFQKIVTLKVLLLGIMIIVSILAITVWLSWARITEILSFEDLNRNCIHDDEEEQRLSRIESIINREEKLGSLIQLVTVYLTKNWDDASIPEPDRQLPNQNGHKNTVVHNQLAQQKHTKTHFANNPSAKRQIFISRHHLHKQD